MEKKPRILAVDDEEQNLKLITEILSDDYTVVEVENGEKALEIVSRDTDFQTIILDWMMPGMDGLEVLKHLKKDAHVREIPVIFHTAKINVEDKITGLESGSFHYLEKPCNPNLLLATVKKAVDEFYHHESERVWRDTAKKGMVGMVQKAEKISDELEGQKGTITDMNNYKLFFDFFERTSQADKLKEAIEAVLRFLKACRFQNWETLKISLLININGNLTAISAEDSKAGLGALEQKILENALQESYVEGAKTFKEDNCFTAWGETSKMGSNEIGVAILIKNFPIIEKAENLEIATKMQEVVLNSLARLMEVIKLQLLAA